MFSRIILKNLAKEISLPVLVSMLQDTAAQLDMQKKEELIEQINTLELFVAEIKKRFPSAPKSPRKPQPESNVKE